MPLARVLWPPDGLGGFGRPRPHPAAVALYGLLARFAGLHMPAAIRGSLPGL
jgi:hypothetical protein